MQFQFFVLIYNFFFKQHWNLFGNWVFRILTLEILEEGIFSFSIIEKVFIIVGTLMKTLLSKGRAIKISSQNII